MTTVEEWFAERDAELHEEDAWFMRDRRGKDLALEFDSVSASGMSPLQELKVERRAQLEETWNRYFSVRHELMLTLEEGEPVEWYEAERYVDEIVSATLSLESLRQREHLWKETD